MRFYEFEAKKLLAKSGVRLPAGGTAETASEAQRLAAEIGGPVVLKSQVLSGGRMKAGGVKFATDSQEAKEAAEEILNLPIRDQLPRCVSVEAKAFVKHEYYLGVTYDALRKLPVMIFSDMGGIDIEQVAEEHPGPRCEGALLVAAAVHRPQGEGAGGVRRDQGQRSDGADRRHDAAGAAVPGIRHDAGGD